MTDKRWENGQNVPGFTKSAKPPSQHREHDVGQAEDTRKPPAAGLHDGPKPPAGVEQSVRRSTSEQQAIERSFAKMEAEAYNRAVKKYNDQVVDYNNDVAAHNSRNGFRKGIGDIGDDGI